MKQKYALEEYPYVVLGLKYIKNCHDSDVLNICSVTSHLEKGFISLKMLLFFFFWFFLEQQYEM